MANEEHLALLKQGVEVWNKWRRINLTLKPNLAGANLNGADLNGANLSDVDLMMADLSGANLTGANLGGAFLMEASLDKAILRGAFLTGANLNEANLTGANLNKAILLWANLVEANLIGAKLKGTFLDEANLNEANLTKAKLNGANLYRTQALNTNFEGATFTGACIEDLQFNSETNLNNVICNDVYLKKGKKERRPHDLNEKFASGEFTKRFQKVLKNTVDLLFSEGIDWNAFDYSLKNAQVLNGNTPLNIEEIENKGDGVVLIKVSVPNNADKHKIDNDFWQGYEFGRKELAAQHQERIKELADQHQNRIEDKNQEINRLFLSFNQAQEKLGEILKLMSEAKKEYHFHDSVGSVDNEGIQNNVAGVVKGNQVGTQHNYASEQKQTLAEAAAEIQQLLKQIEKSNPTATVEQQQVFVDAAVSPTLKARFVSALQAGWKESIKELLDNPYVNVGVAILEGWQEAD